MHKLIVSFLLLILISPLYSFDWFWRRQRELDNMEKEDIIELVKSLEKENEEMKDAIKNYQKMEKEYNILYREHRRSSKIPVWFVNKRFSFQAGVSAFIDPENPLKSNFDFIFLGSFYNRWQVISIGYQPINKNLFFMGGVFFPY